MGQLLSFCSFLIVGALSDTGSPCDDNSSVESPTPLDDQARLRLKRKLQRNRTSFTNEQIESLEKGNFFTRIFIPNIHFNL